ncbi:MAG: polyphosphate polymerase domain-containing protein [Kiritimatiellia bacterium]
MAAQSDTVSRYESKYIIPRSLVGPIRDFIRPFCEPDPHTRGTPPEYVITTLQLETPGYALHFAKENEMDARFKLRVRTYGEIGSAPVFAEIKAKYERTIVKARACVPFEAWTKELVYGTRVPRVFRNARQEIDFLTFRRVVWETGARPETLVRYTRESYIGVVDDYVRVTFDRRLQYQRTDSWTDFGRGGVWRGMDSATAQGFGLPYSGVVLEIKTYNTVPAWTIELVRRFDLSRSGNCKYSTAIWREGAFTGYPPTNAAQQQVLSMAV